MACAIGRQVDVERRSDEPQKRPSALSDRDSPTVDLHHTCVVERPECVDFGGKVTAGCYFVEIDGEITHQPLDYMSA